VVFLDVNHGWVYGGRDSGSYRQIVHRTTNAGLTWTSAAIDTPSFQSTVTDLSFLGSQLVWCVNQYGVYKSLDGGVHWNHIYVDPGSSMFLSVWYVDELHGWMAGVGGKVSVTTDGGVTWQPQVSGTRTQLQRIRFIDAQRGWAIGLGDIISTRDGGAHWTVEELATNEWLLDNSFIAQGNEFSLWACGYKGTMLRLRDQLTAVSETHTPMLDNSYQLYQNYPNPFNPSTTIKYVLPHQSFVSLKVFDVLGRELTMLVDEQKQPGEYSVTFNASELPSGVYFYRLRTGDVVQTRKLIVIR
jgi:photosystem II stability/assembly factor-like uncharacterized protein